VEDAPKFGATDVFVADDYWLRTKHPQHWRDTQHLWSRPDVRGCNWFAFKPYFIRKMLERCKEGDALLYLDADTYPVADIKCCFDITRRDGHMVFHCVGQLHKWWCTRACFVEMGIPVDPAGVPIDRAKFFDVPHGCARFLGLLPTPENFQFLDDWYRYCLNLDCTTFEDGRKFERLTKKYGPEQPELHQHRTEQAIMTNLVLLRGWRMWREACQFGESVDTDRDVYPQLFYQNGSHSWDPSPRWPGSSFRNIND